jgi:hypothetical protein
MNRSHATSLITRLAGRGRVLAFILAVPLPTMLGACGSSSQGASAATTPRVRTDAATVSAANKAPESPQVSCGAAAPATLAKAAGRVAMQIYAHELSGSGVRADQRQVESNGPLLNALASGNLAGVREAVRSLVYSHTHIVRLRVVQGSMVQADIGGPYIIAPVSGSLRFHGRTVGHYLLSVQDDLGYVKLETRYVGLPLVLQTGALRIPLEGTLAAAPASIPNLGPVTYRGTSYEAFSFEAKAFPQGKLRISLLVPVPRSLASESCTAIKLSEMAHIAQLVWHRYSLVSAPSSAYVNQVRSLTGGLSYVRSTTQQLAGSTRPGPTRLPNQGTVRYRGATWQVSSFSSHAPAGPVRVYVLVG